MMMMMSVYMQDSPGDEAQHRHSEVKSCRRRETWRCYDPVRGLKSSADYFRAVCYRVTAEGAQIDPSYFILNHLDLTPGCAGTHQHTKRT